MAITSVLSTLVANDLGDIPLGNNGDITRLANGGYAVIAEVQTGLFPGGDNFSILRVFDAAGQPVRSLAIEGTAPAIAGLSDGRIVVTTQTDAGSMTPTIVRADFLSFETLTSASLLSGAVSAGADGTFVTANTEQFSSDRDIDLVFYDADGSILVNVGIENTTNIDSRDVDVAVLTNGNAVVTRTHTDLTTGVDSLVFSVHDSSGNLIVPDTVIPDSAGPGGENSHARLVATATGFAIVYSTRVFASTDLDIRLRTFDFDGNQISDTLITNTEFGNTGADDGFTDSDPDIAIGPDGNIAITWTRFDGLDTNQMLFVLGQGAPVIVREGRADHLQSNPLVTFFGDGQIAVYHTDDAESALVGEHFFGARTSTGEDGVDDTFAGDDFRDDVSGLGGNDTLSGGNNDDTLNGGDGRDVLFGGSGNDFMLGEASGGALTVGNHSDRMEGQAGNDQMSGQNGNDTLLGGSGSDFISGGVGNDRLLGGGDADNLQGDAGRDLLDGSLGDDTLFGGSENDRMKGGSGDDALDGGTENDTLQGGEDNDTLEGGDGDDRLEGGAQSDNLFGGNGNDLMIGGADGGDEFFGGADNDRILGGVAADRAFGGAGNDTVTGNAGDDTLFGDEGNDFLLGGDNDDTLQGGSGLDNLTGGLGEDAFLFFETDSVDVIVDFFVADDTIQLLAFTFTALGGSVAGNELRFGTVAVDGNDFLIYDAATGILRYDADANGLGAAVAFANIGAGQSLTFRDFEMV